MTVDAYCQSISVFDSILAIRSALNYSVAYPNSELFVITTATPSDEANRHGAVELISDMHVHVNYIYVSTKMCAPHDSVMAAVAATAYSSGGSLAITDRTNVQEYLAAFLPTLYGISTIANPTYPAQFKCAGHSDLYVQVGEDTTSIFVAATSRYGSIGVVNPLK
ncbi:hypothetical protein OSTOST_16670, partial [Ostertagia ostertagi]